MADQFVGEIRLVGFNFAPLGWANANGSLLPISQNTALFSLLGINFGGNGQTTFGLPNLDGRAAVGFGQGPGLANYNLGQSFGENSVTITNTTMPAHSHPRAVSTARADRSNATGNIAAVTSDAVYGNPATAVSMASTAQSATGLGQPHNNLMPSIVLRYIIALQGIFPPRA